MRKLLANIVAWRLETRLERTDALRGLTDDGWVALYKSGVVIPDDLRCMTFRANPTLLQRLRFAILALLSMLLVCGVLLGQSGNIDITQIKTASKKGTGAQLQVFGGGSTTNGHAAVYNAAGAVIDGGGSSGGGSLMVQPPTLFPRYQAPVMPLALSVTSPVTVASSTSATSIIGKTYFGSATLPAGYWVGKPIRVRASGLYGSTGTPTLTVTVILGGVTIATITPTILASVSNDGWTLEYSFTPVSMTATNGAGCFSDVGTSGAIIGGCASGQTTGLDFSTAQTLDVKVQWSASSSSNTITAEVLQVS